ncbi:MAG TPA: hypothetical protein VM840_06600 [Actinomycetota bacterium]|nr:hypothetical protein [Actinomycetota bacterium]
MRDAQVQILQMFANGLVTAEQAERLMDALDAPRALRQDPARAGKRVPVRDDRTEVA